MNHRALLLSVLREGNRYKREDMLSHANGDQINVVSELNLSKKSTSIISTDGQIEKKHKIVLKELKEKSPDESEKIWILASTAQSLLQLFSSMEEEEEDGHTVEVCVDCN